tara:strand:- start:2616 stop:2807 length:192 start_codon:yes stop_codon:yes gene_type:complete
MNRFDHLHKQYREARLRERKEAILQKSRITVDSNAGGTSGYRVKNGVNAGKVLAHITVDTRDL